MTAAPDPVARWQRIREQHARRPHPYAAHYAPGCGHCDTQGCWLDDYAAEWLAEHAPEQTL